MLSNTFMVSPRLIGCSTFNSVIKRSSSSTKSVNDNVKPFITNRNPRNLERLHIAKKPKGYHLDKPGREFWHKLEIIKKNRYIVGQVIHNNGSIVVKVSSNEPGIGKHLYRANDMSAYVNIARILALRCFECGIHTMTTNIDPSSGEKIAAFLEEVQKEGIALVEPLEYKPLTPWTFNVMVKPWSVHEEK